jgi:hypothetical protein
MGFCRYCMHSKGSSDLTYFRCLVQTQESVWHHKHLWLQIEEMPLITNLGKKPIHVQNNSCFETCLSKSFIRSLFHIPGRRTKQVLWTFPKSSKTGKRITRLNFGIVNLFQLHQNQFAESRNDLQLDVSKVVSKGCHKILCHQTFVPVCMITPGWKYTRDLIHHTSKNK